MSLIHSYTGYFDQVTCVSSRVKITGNSTVVFVQPNCTENTWDPHCWPFVRGTTGDWGSNAKNLSMSWCHHESFPMSRCLMFVESRIVVVATWWSMRKLTRSGVPATSKYNYLKKKGWQYLEFVAMMAGGTYPAHENCVPGKYHELKPHSLVLRRNEGTLIVFNLLVRYWPSE